jgi:hypothetical protein
MVRSKASAQDIFAGTILLVLALIGWWLNQEHPLGNARRMGPGYMPMLAFWIQGALGVAVLVFAMISGPRPVGRDAWTEIILATISGSVLFVLWLALGRPATIPFVAVAVWLGGSIAIGLWFRSNMMPILAAMAFFWFSLERVGFAAALFGTVMISALAERPPRVERMLSIALLLILLCYAIFIAFLDIRVPLFPGDLDQAVRAIAQSESPAQSAWLSWSGLVIWGIGIWLSVVVLLKTNNDETTMGVHLLSAAAVVVSLGGFLLTELGGKRLSILGDVMRVVFAPVRFLISLF